MTNEHGQQPAPRPNEGESPAWFPLQPQGSPEGGRWQGQPPPGIPPYGPAGSWPPPYQPGYGGWAYGPPPAPPSGHAGWPGPGGQSPGGRRRGRRGLMVAGGVAALLVAGTAGGVIGDAIGSASTGGVSGFSGAAGPVRQTRRPSLLALIRDWWTSISRSTTARREPLAPAWCSPPMARCSPTITSLTVPPPSASPTLATAGPTGLVWPVTTRAGTWPSCSCPVPPTCKPSRSTARRTFP